MPGFDRTGPNGEGPRTGRGLGRCNPKKDESDEKNREDMNPQDEWYGRGMGWRHGRGGFRGRGPGRGRRFRGGQ
jgi:hypothetical protein